MATRSDSLKRSATTNATVAENDGSSTAFSRPPTESPLRSRRPGMMSPRSSESPAAQRSGPRRRSSMISLGSDLSVDSFRSKTDDLFLPRASRHGGLQSTEEEHSSHLHSLPLFLAIVPAIMGIFFQNGTAIMTDLTLLAMAAIFLNWSIRIPWDWYRSAQAVRQHDSISTEDFLPPGVDDTIIEEGSDAEEDATRDGKENAEGIAEEQETTKQKGGTASAHPGRVSSEQLSAASSLRRHEIFALIACFICPVAGAALLHGIREQLSRPSEGLVSNYNLTIFLLAAEIRPLSHLIKLIQHRTLHLQQVVARNPYGPSGPADGTGIPGGNDALAALAARIAAIESNGLPAHSPLRDGAMSPASPSSPGPAPPIVSKDQLVSDVRRSMQPDIDALNRAVRRYEKRATLLSLQVDGRLSALESRVADSIALAAAAERSANGARKGSAATLLDWAAGCVVVPVRTGGWLAIRILEVPARAGKWLVGLGGEVLGLVKGSRKASDPRRRGPDGRQRSKAKDQEGIRPKMKRAA